MLDKIKITYKYYEILISSKKLSGNAALRFLLCIVLFLFVAPDSTLMTFNSKQFMHRTYNVKFKFR